MNLLNNCCAAALPPVTNGTHGYACIGH